MRWHKKGKGIFLKVVKINKILIPHHLISSEKSYLFTSPFERIIAKLDNESIYVTPEEKKHRLI